MSFYKDWLMERVDEIAAERDVNFYDLPASEQDAIYRQAEDDFRDQMAAIADGLNDRARESL